MTHARPSRWRGRLPCVFALLALFGCDDGDSSDPSAGAGGAFAGAGGGEDAPPPGPIECRDGVQSALETDVDCGGPDCIGCSLGGACERSDDCLFGTCSMGVCACPDGFDAQGGLCVRADVCAALGCGARADCVEGALGVECVCQPGFELVDDACVDLDECAIPNVCPYAGTTCVNAPGGFECACAEGFALDGDSCVDVDECAADPCGPGECVNAVGGFECVCDVGYTFSEGACVDVDECADPATECGFNASCVNVEGDYACTCDAGYRRRAGACVDVDECRDDPCGANSQCENTPGGFECSCLPGFVDGLDGCADRDECALALDDCDASQVCANAPGGFECVCADGYRDLGDGTCQDINECVPFDVCGRDDIACLESWTPPCDGDAACDNTLGGFECACVNGMVGDGVRAEDGGSGCAFQPSCAAILAADPMAQTGFFTIQPEGQAPLQALCVMGPGYAHTVVRRDVRQLPTGPGAQAAYRAECEAIGMELVVPRTKAQFDAMVTAYGERPNLVGVYRDPAVMDESPEAGFGRFHGRCRGEPCSFYLDDQNVTVCDAWFEPDGDADEATALWLSPRCDGHYVDGRGEPVDLGGRVFCSPNTAALPTPQGCADIMDRGAAVNTRRGGINGPYLVDPDGNGPEPEHEVWCNHTVDGGGWTLAMQDPHGVFDYAHPAWTDDRLIEPEEMDFGPRTLPSFEPFKLASWLDVPVGEIMLSSSIGRLDPPAVSLVVLDEVPSLRALFTEGAAIEPVGLAAWEAGLDIRPGRPQRRCPTEGVNLPGADDAPLLRLGIITSADDRCADRTPLGVGLAADACERGACGLPFGAPGFTLWVRPPR